MPIINPVLPAGNYFTKKSCLMSKPLILLFTIVSLHLHVNAQNVINVKDVVDKLRTLSTSKIIERAYLHFDKPSYNPGDTLYFKAYVTAGENHELTKISSLLHVDLISKNDSLMQSIILQLSNGMAAGDFALPAYTPKGNFRVRAYTQWMQNTGDKYFFDRIIPVTGKSIARVNNAAKGVTNPDVQFFAEGGTMVTALPARVAFKAIGPDGLAVAVKGIVEDNTGTEITKFTTAHLGMGQFFITPEAGKTYSARVTYLDGSTAKIDLPKVDEKGLTLTVNNQSESKLSIDINANKPFYLENKNKELNVVMYQDGVVKTVKTVLDNQVIGFDLPKKDLKTGVLQITVFGPDGSPANERLVFIRNDDLLNLALVSDKPVYATNDVIKIDLNAKASETPAPGYFSVAVLNESALASDENTGHNILTDLLLTSAVKGYIEQPGYYFTGAADANTNLDILLLTQGYRRFTWAGLLNDTEPAFAFKPENGMLISGHLNTKDGKALPQEKVTLLLPESGQSLTVLTDNSGKLVFADLGYTDRAKFLIKIENGAIKNKAVVLMDKNAKAVAINPNREPLSSLDENLTTVAGLGNNEISINQAKGTDQKPINVKQTYRTTSLNGAGNADQVFFRKEFKDSPNLTAALAGKIRGATIVNGKVYATSSLIASATSTGPEPMQLVVDGLLVRDATLDLYLPNQIETVEILKGNNAAIYGIIGGAGVVVLTSRQGDSADDDGMAVSAMSPGLVSIRPPGYYKSREFYSPKYKVAGEQVNNSRGTVYWNPNLTTDKDGHTSFSFGNGNAPGSYRVIVEGIDTAGNPGRSVITFKVQ
ncbi:hypothetical protein A0256_09140 [Mucilaginibacter sp. PAMC 26640]|nr:hypothetical protein A0256_09140 [Mucilaginibacter sp. PAMC 26640]